MIGTFCTHRSICLNIGFRYGSFVWKWCTFNLSALIKKRYSSFLKNFFVFAKIYFKVKVLKTHKISTNSYIKTYQLLKRRAILKIPITFFRKIYALSVGFKMNPLRKRFPVLRQKLTQNLLWNFLKGSTILFYCLFDESYFSNICAL